MTKSLTQTPFSAILKPDLIFSDHCTTLLIFKYSMGPDLFFGIGITQTYKKHKPKKLIICMRLLFSLTPSLESAKYFPVHCVQVKKKQQKKHSGTAQASHHRSPHLTPDSEKEDAHLNVCNEGALLLLITTKQRVLWGKKRCLKKFLCYMDVFSRCASRCRPF